MTEVNSRKVVEIVNSTPNSETVKIRNLYEPIFYQLWKLASATLEAYHTDVIHDALMLADSQVGEKFLWGYRATGTTLIRLKSGRELAIATIATMTNPLENWHLIEITKMRTGGHADGYVTWINARNLEQMKRVVRDNVPEVQSETLSSNVAG